MSYDLAPSSDFPSTTENEALKEIICQRIGEVGAITFREFMALALYHPRHGYYCSPREKMGRQGDYLTSPEVHPMFGWLMGKQLRQMWEVMGRPQPFTIVEMGAGSGALARDILDWAHRHAPEFFAGLEYRLVEVSDELAAHQRRAVQSALGGDEGLQKAAWLPSLDAIGEGSVVGCLLSNELADAFPVHRVTVRGGHLQEVYVGWRSGRFEEELGPPSAPALEDYFRRLGLLPGEDCQAEVNLDALDWMRAVARALGRGFVMTFDYGYPADQLYAPWRRQGTFLCFYRHNPSVDPYVRVGRQDMTSHVDFTSLIQAGEEAGLETVGLTSQARFLDALGIGGALAGAAQAELSLEEYYARRRALTELLDPAGLGRIQVLVQGKGVQSPRLLGLEAA
ncbi:MAG TPA: SAM-dependent methyltransferase [Dehalococcoidia bacterium]|nr:SAM-dependent methyltransferase [Dehalococcoidia bacterium]